MAQRALITGITGQDAAYLTKLLLDKGYEVYGAHRRSASMNVWRLHEMGVHNDVKFVPLDLMEFSNILRLVDKVQPDEVYNLAAQSFVGISFEEPIYTGDVDGIGVVRLLEAVRLVNPKIRFYQASTSEMFGKAQEVPQSETTPFWPRSPYGVAKVFAYWATVNYRESYGLHASNGILFNHESPRRGETFVTRKISRVVARIKYGLENALFLGNLDAQRDWGYAPEFVEGMWLMLQQDEPDDYVLATNETHTVREFAEKAFAHVGLNWEDFVQHDKRYERPAEVDLLIGNGAKAKKQLGWEPKVRFDDLVRIMVDADMESLRQQLEK